MTAPERFRSMGCEVLVAGACPAALAEIRRLFTARERLFSRFIPESELNRVNREPGRAVPVSRIFARTLETALRAAEETGGLVDPTLGQALEAAGYTADFAQLRPDRRPAGAGRRGVWRQVRVLDRLVIRPPGVLLDLNGVVKSLAVDDALRFLDAGFVSAGGDLASRGALDVSLPGTDAVRLVQGALSTSGTATRRWLRGGRLQHHLIDPATGVPAHSPWEQATVAGKTCLAADVAAKAGFLLGRGGPAWLDERGLPGRFVDAAGEVVVNETWRRQLAGRLSCT